MIAATVAAHITFILQGAALAFFFSQHMTKLITHIYQWLIAVPIILVLTLVTAVVTGIGCALLNRDWWGYYPPRLWARCFCWIMFVRVKVQGREHVESGTSYVFVANHQGAYDIFSIYGFLNHNFRWMMRKGLRNFPIVGQACALAGHVMVDSHNQAALMRTMHDAEQRLQAGMSLVVFPEGRRTDDGHMGQFKSGAFKLAQEFNLSVVPISISGSYRVMPRSTFNVTPGTITLTLHKPITLDSCNGDLHRLAQQCQSVIAHSMHE